MAELTEDSARALCGVHRVDLPDGKYVFVRTLTGSDLAKMSSLGDDPMGKLFVMLLSDETGQQRYTNGAVPTFYPLWLIKKVCEEGMAFNHLSEELEERAKN